MCNNVLQDRKARDNGSNKNHWRKYFEYLGIEEGGVDLCDTKEKHKKENFQRIRKILKTDMNAKNQITLIRRQKFKTNWKVGYSNIMQKTRTN